MSMKTASFTKDGPPVGLKIEFGYANAGGYRIYLYDAQGKNPQFVGEGKNTDVKPDSFVLDSSNLDGRILRIESNIALPSAGAVTTTNHYSLVATISQETAPPSEDTVTFDGTLNNGHISIIEYIKLKAS